MRDYIREEFKTETLQYTTSGTCSSETIQYTLLTDNLRLFTIQFSAIAQVMADADQRDGVGRLRLES